MKVLLAVDGSKYSRAAANSIAMRPWPAGSVIKVLSAYECPYYAVSETWLAPENFYAEIEAANKTQAQKAVEYAADLIRESQIAQVEVIPEIKEGFAKEVIRSEAKNWDADLIILGSHGYGGLQRFLLGSVSHTVAQHAPCSVEITRLKDI